MMKLVFFKFLQEHDVGKMFPLVRGRLPNCEEHNIIFLVRPRLETMDIIAENIKYNNIAFVKIIFTYYSTYNTVCFFGKHLTFGVTYSRLFLYSTLDLTLQQLVAMGYLYCSSFKFRNFSCILGVTGKTTTKNFIFFLYQAKVTYVKQHQRYR